jgi:uncharacterized phage protein (TIGR02218 family)
LDSGKLQIHEYQAMKSASPALVQLLGSATQLLMADLYAITLINGAVLRFTSADIAVTLAGVTYPANGPTIDGLRYKIAVGLDVDEQTITIAARPTDLINGVPLLTALRRGALDGARLERARAFLAAWGQPAIDGVTLFSGRVSTIDQIGRTVAQIKVKSDLVLLDIDMPRNTYQTGCIHGLYDSGCGLSKASHAVTGAVANGSGVGAINWSGATAGTFDQGTINFTSGANAGISQTIKQATGSALILAYPLDVAPGVGDGFIAYPGCDKTMATCAARFNNLSHYRGFPYTPVAETAF